MGRLAWNLFAGAALLCGTGCADDGPASDGGFDPPGCTEGRAGAKVSACAVDNALGLHAPVVWSTPILGAGHHEAFAYDNIQVVPGPDGAAWFRIDGSRPVDFGCGVVDRPPADSSEMWVTTGRVTPGGNIEVFDVTPHNEAVMSLIPDPETGSVWALGYDFSWGGTCRSRSLVQLDDAGRAVATRNYAALGEEVHIDRVAFGPSGRVAIAGEFRGTIDFGQGPLSFEDHSFYLAVFDGDNAVMWSTTFGTGSCHFECPDFLGSLLFTRTGDVLLSGTGTHVLGSRDQGYVARFGPSGALSSVRSFEFGETPGLIGTPNGLVAVLAGTVELWNENLERVWRVAPEPPLAAISTDAAGNVYLAASNGGLFADHTRARFGGEPVDLDPNSIVVGKLDAEGTQRGVYVFPSAPSSAATPTSLVAGADGGFVVGALTESTLEDGSTEGMTFMFRAEP
jgi:hypothetical protein